MKELWREAMPIIDADAHVIENEATWDYLEGSDRRFRPVPISAKMPSGNQQSFWIIDGRLIGGRDNKGVDTPVEAREMTDIPRRLDSCCLSRPEDRMPRVSRPESGRQHRSGL